MIVRTTLIAVLLASSAFAQTPATKSDTEADCSNLKDYDQYEQLRLDSQHLYKECVNKGKNDPPLEWRPPPGEMVRGIGATSTLTHAQNAPEAPPGNVNAPASVSNSRWARALTMPPWQGFPCQLPGGISLCGGGNADGSNGGASSCPASTDTSGTFGQMLPLNTLTSKALTCGGATTLSSTPFSSVASATRIAITTGNEFNIRVYKLDTTTGKFALYDNVPLPQQLCQPGPGGTMTPTVQVPAPIAQIIAYAENTTHLNLRLQYAGVNLYDPFQPDPNATREKMLVVPIVAGVPKDMTNPCDNESRLTSSPPPAGTFDIMPSGGGANLAVNEVDGSSAAGYCDTSTLYPEGSACGNLMLIVTSDDPQLVHTPGTTAEFFPIADRGEVMNKSTANSLLMVGNGTLMRIDGLGQSVGLPDGGAIPLNNGNLLKMDGPVDIRGGSSTITLTSGGKITNPSGELVSEYSAGATVMPAANLPFLIRPNNRIQLPSSLLLPGKDGGHLRLPVSTQ